MNAPHENHEAVIKKEVAELLAAPRFGETSLRLFWHDGHLVRIERGKAEKAEAFGKAEKS